MPIASAPVEATALHQSTLTGEGDDHLIFLPLTINSNGSQTDTIGLEPLAASGTVGDVACIVVGLASVFPSGRLASFILNSASLACTASSLPSDAPPFNRYAANCFPQLGFYGSCEWARNDRNVQDWISSGKALNGTIEGVPDEGGRLTCIYIVSKHGMYHWSAAQNQSGCTSGHFAEAPASRPPTATPTQRPTSTPRPRPTATPRPRPTATPTSVPSPAICRKRPLLKYRDGYSSNGTAYKRPDVRALQSLINQKFSYRLVVDGYFGPKTRSAVWNIQSAYRHYHGAPDGIVGPKTWNILCGTM